MQLTWTVTAQRAESFSARASVLSTITSGHSLRFYSRSISWFTLHDHKLTLKNCHGIHVSTSRGSLNAGQLKKKHMVKGFITGHLFLFNKFNYPLPEFCRSTSLLTGTCHLWCAVSLTATHDHVHRERTWKMGMSTRWLFTLPTNTAKLRAPIQSFLPSRKVFPEKFIQRSFCYSAAAIFHLILFFPFPFIWEIPLHCSGWSAIDSQGWYSFQHHLQYLTSHSINRPVWVISPFACFSTSPSPFASNSVSTPVFPKLRLETDGSPIRHRAQLKEWSHNQLHNIEYKHCKIQMLLSHFDL